MRQYVFSPVTNAFKVAYLTNQLGTNQNISIYEIKNKVGAGVWGPGLGSLGAAAGLWDEYVELTVAQLIDKAVALDFSLKSYADRVAETELNTKLANFLTFSTGVVGEVVAIDRVAKTVAITVPNGTTVTALACSFTTNTLTSIKIGATAQVSGTTQNNFTSPKVYRLMAADGVTYKDYTVTVTVAA